MNYRHFTKIIGSVFDDVGKFSLFVSFQFQNHQGQPMEMAKN